MNFTKLNPRRLWHILRLNPLFAVWLAAAVIAIALMSDSANAAATIDVQMLLLATTPPNLDGFRYTEVTSISTDGSLVIGNGFDSMGQPQAWFVRSVPEPTVLVLVALAAAGLFCIRRRGVAPPMIAALAILLVSVAGARAATTIPGIDVIVKQKPSGSPAQVAIGDGGLPILPPNFFGPGSLPFGGPLNIGVGEVIVRRNTPGVFEMGVATIETELLQLSLTSVTPIEPVPGSLYDVSINMHTNSPGQIRLQETTPNGGLLVDSFFDVFFDMLFVPRQLGPILSLSGDMQLLFGAPVPWTNELPGGGLPAGGSNFVLGSDGMQLREFTLQSPDGGFSLPVVTAIAIPEPASIGLLCCGAGVFGASAWRRRRRKRAGHDGENRSPNESSRRFAQIFACVAAASLFTAASNAWAGVISSTPPPHNNDDYTVGPISTINEGMIGGSLLSDSAYLVTNSVDTTEYRISITFGPFSQPTAKLRIELGAGSGAGFVPLSTSSTNPPAGLDMDWDLLQQTPAPTSIPGMTTTHGQYFVEWNGNLPASTAATPQVYMDVPNIVGAAGYSMTVRLSRTVPEPGTMGLLALGAMLGFVRRAAILDA